VPQPPSSTNEVWELLTTRYVRNAREVGALGVLPIMLDHLAVVRVHQGELNEASTLVDEADRIAAASGGPRAAGTGLALGLEAAARALLS
jgi:hypothetical protein